MQVYTGKKDGGVQQGLGYQVVYDLTRKVAGKGHHVFCDNFFTSVKLAEDLLKDSIYLCGTTRSNRKDFPAELKDAAAIKKLRRGESIFRQKGNVVCTIWKDKKAVAFISTQCEAKGIETVNRRQKDGSILKVDSLPVVTLYNKFMGGVDKADQYRQYYEVTRHAQKWWRYLFWFGLDVAVVNAHILMNLAPNHPSLTQLKFRVELARGLINGFSSRKHAVHEGSIQDGHWPMQMTKGRCKRCLKNGITKFCRQGCEKCAKRYCLNCFKNHNQDQ
ncbi:piggyBac transposable element-derived protein 4-like [Nematostella vectensis]|uniref:piggyBac transposable element-derived protein 4-like n=1 Tax=Nematostella vectensis TaxID=45351 RepID=UPI00207762B4|nr:piggyBac transposable element-derived protein 4-like [Nematostella vectensis]